MLADWALTADQSKPHHRADLRPAPGILLLFFLSEQTAASLTWWHHQNHPIRELAVSHVTHAHSSWFRPAELQTWRSTMTQNSPVWHHTAPVSIVQSVQPVRLHRLVHAPVKVFWSKLVLISLQSIHCVFRGCQLHSAATSAAQRTSTAQHHLNQDTTTSEELRRSRWTLPPVKQSSSLVTTCSLLTDKLRTDTFSSHREHPDWKHDKHFITAQDGRDMNLEHLLPHRCDPYNTPDRTMWSPERLSRCELSLTGPAHITGVCACYNFHQHVSVKHINWVWHQPVTSQRRSTELVQSSSAQHQTASESRTVISYSSYLFTPVHSCSHLFIPVHRGGNLWAPHDSILNRFSMQQVFLCTFPCTI